LIYQPFAEQEATHTYICYLVIVRTMSQSTLQNSASLRAGAHTVFKENLKQELNSRVSSTIRVRAGPSWDERMEKSVKGFQAKARLSEGEQKKTLTECIEKGRSRATSAPFRDASLAPNSQAMLLQRKKKMHDLEVEYRDRLGALKDKMDKREPLFRLADVNSAFAMQRERMLERKREMQRDESERWEHLRVVEESASSRPLLIEDPHYRAPKKAKSPTKSASSPDVSGIDASITTNPAIFGGREEYEKDIKIRDAINTPWFQNSDWAKTVREIKDRADNRQKLHEISYPNKGDGHALTRGRLMHTLPAQVPAVY